MLFSFDKHKPCQKRIESSFCYHFWAENINFTIFIYFVYAYYILYFSHFHYFDEKKRQNKHHFPIFLLKNRNADIFHQNETSQL